MPATLPAALLVSTEHVTAQAMSMTSAAMRMPEDYRGGSSSARPLERTLRVFGWFNVEIGRSSGPVFWGGWPTGGKLRVGHGQAV